MSFLALWVALLIPLCSLHPYPETISITHDMPSRIQTGEEKEFSITLNKGVISGPARLRVEVKQSGMEFSPVELAGGELLNEGDMHAVVWTEIPAGPTVTVKLKIKGHRFFTGIFIARFSLSCLENGSTVEKDLGKHDIRMSSAGTGSGSSAISQTTTNENTGGNNQNTSQQSTETTSTTENPTNTNTTTTNNTVSNTSTTTSNTTTTTSSTGATTMIDPITKKPGTPIKDASTIKGLFFRVQVAASHFLVTQEYFTDRYKFDEQLYVDNVDGWVKYTIGEYLTFEEANEKRKTLTVYPFKGPFIVAFNDGQRIPIYNARQLSKVVKN